MRLTGAGGKAPALRGGARWVGLLVVLAFGPGCSDGPEGSARMVEPVASQPGGSPAAAAGTAVPAAGMGAAGGAAATGALPPSTGGTTAAGGSAVPPGPGTQPDAAASAGTGADAGSPEPTADAGTSPAATPILPPVTSVEMNGSFATTQDLAGGPQRRSGLFHPSELGKDGLEHPVFVWGCGGGSRPSSYAMHLNRIASHGFVVIAEVSAIGDNGAPLKAAIDWLSAEHARMGSPFFGKLDLTRIAAGGHSIGSVNTFLMASDPRLRTTIHVAGGSLDNVNDPSAPTTGKGGKSLIHPVAYICSASDLFGNVEKTEQDYAATTVPAFFTIIAGSDHVAATADGLPAILAWLRWQLGGEEARRADFLEPAGVFQTGKYASKIKNW